MKNKSSITKPKIKVTGRIFIKRRRPKPVKKVKKQRVFKGFAKVQGENK